MQKVGSEKEAKAVIEYFNGFHDGFLKRVLLVCNDTFEKEGPDEWNIAHQLTGDFDCILEVAHYNYGNRIQPLSRIVRCTFKGVHEFCLDLHGVAAHEWPIKNTYMETVDWEHEHGNSKQCLSLSFLWSKLIENQWSDRKAQILLFTEATFEEIDRT